MKKRKILFKSFVKSQIGYFPLTWKFHGRKMNSETNLVHQITLDITYKNNVLPFEKLLELDKSFKISHRSIQSIAFELFEMKSNLSNTIIINIFQPRAVTYNLWS